MKLYDNGQRYAFKVDLPAPADRPNPDTVAALDRWNMVLPGDHPMWDRYTVIGTRLCELPGVPPAFKKFKEATHEIVVAAIDPRFKHEKFAAGGIQFLEPINYCEQFISTDEDANELIEHLAAMFVQQLLTPEPCGFIGARQKFRDEVYKFINEKARIRNTRGSK